MLQAVYIWPQKVRSFSLYKRGNSVYSGRKALNVAPLLAGIYLSSQSA